MLKKALTRMHSKIHLHFGEPIDLFGNAVDADGISHDLRGRPVNRRRYVERQDEPVFEPQRDQEYTRELGRSLVRAYLKNNFILATHAAGYAAFHLLRQRNPAYDLYRFLRTEGKDSGIDQQILIEGLEKLMVVLLEYDAAGKLQLEPKLRQMNANEIFANAMAHFSTFHDGRTLKLDQGKVFSEDMKLLYYYRNRLDHYGLERAFG